MMASFKAQPNRLSFLVDEELAGSRLDKFLAQALIGEHSRERLQQLIKEGQVWVLEQPVLKPSYTLKEGDVVTCVIPFLQAIALQAEAIPLEVIFEDDYLLVVNKPAGMLTHPTGKEQTGTLVNALLYHCAGGLSGINGQVRPGIVHRLDRDTAGLLMVAKTDKAHWGLSEQLKTKTARRNYIAIVQGRFNKPSGTVDAPIGRDPKHRDKMGIQPDGRAAITHWELLHSSQDKLAQVYLKLETGRTHQIRVHMAHIGHPLVNDPLYGTGLGRLLKLPEKLHIPGQLLQAVALGFAHPITAEAMRFEMPFNADMQRAWNYLTAQE